MKTDRNLGAFEIADKQSVTWDLVSLGEVVLRLDPGDMRIATTRQFRYSRAEEIQCRAGPEAMFWPAHRNCNGACG